MHRLLENWDKVETKIVDQSAKFSLESGESYALTLQYQDQDDINLGLKTELEELEGNWIKMKFKKRDCSKIFKNEKDET